MRRGGLPGIAIIGTLTVAAAPFARAQSDIPDCAAASSQSIRSEIAASIGLPELHNSELAPQEHDVVCHDRFCAEYSLPHGTPLWVVERLTPSIVTGKNTRPNTSWGKFRLVPKNLSWTKNSDYTNSGFARGHMAASADFKCHITWMEQTFIFSNAAPQLQQGFNGAIWRSLEERVQELAKRRDEIFVITGPIHLSPDQASITIEKNINACENEITLPGDQPLAKRRICGAKKDCDPGVAVPAGLFKIIVIPETGRVFGFAMANINHTRLKPSNQSDDEYLKDWQVSIEVIEKITNLRFLTAWSARDRRVARRHCTVTRWE